jgi:hypothetical protein
MQTIDLTPTPEGFANMAKALLASVIGDVPALRRAGAKAQLDSVLEIVAYLAAIEQPTLVVAIRKSLA